MPRSARALLLTATLLIGVSSHLVDAGDPPNELSESLSWKFGVDWPRDPKRSEAEQLGMWSATWYGLVAKHKFERYTVWARYGLDPFDVRLSGKLKELANAMLHFGNIELGDPAFEGVAPHRVARIAVHPMGSPRAPAFDVMLVEEDGWRILRADLLRADRDLPAATAAAAIATLEKAWRSIDAGDSASFAGVFAVMAANRELRTAEPKEAEVVLVGLREKYASRPRRVLPAIHVPSNGFDAVEVPLLIGDREALVYCLIGKMERDDWRLVRVTNGVLADADIADPPGAPKGAPADSGGAGK